MTIQLTPSQRAILTHAHQHTEGKIIWFPENIKGGAFAGAGAAANDDQVHAY